MHCNATPPKNNHPFLLRATHYLKDTAHKTHIAYIDKMNERASI